MNRVAKRYCIPCRCSATVLVGPGQAGGRTVCPACGGDVDVPRLRDLEQFAAGVDSASAPRRWHACHAWLLAGAAVALLAASVAILVGTLARAQPAFLPNPMAIRAAVDATDAVTLHRAWLGMRLSGVDRGALPEESRVQRVAGMAALVAGLLWIVSALGAVVAAAAGIACLAGPRAGSGEAVARDHAPASGVRA